MKNEEDLLTYVDFFASIKDFRDKKRTLYPLPEVLFLIFCAQLANFDSLRDYKLFFEIKKDFLRKFYPYKNGCPSINTILRILSICKPSFFEDLITEIANRQRNKTSVEKSIVAVDGKTHRGTPDPDGHLLHTVSLYSDADRLILGQTATETKGGEIAAALKLFEKIDISDQIITGDSAFCYHSIVCSVIKNKADYILQVKKNQPNLFSFIENKFNNNQSVVSETEDRYSKKKIHVMYDVNQYKELEKWQNIKSLVKIESRSKRTDRTENFYYVSSVTDAASKIATYIRAHWSIENDLHWFLDVVFKEDSRVILEKNFATNEGIVRRLALSGLKKIQALAVTKLNMKHVAIKSLRKLLMADDELFEEAIYAVFK